jgi:hypothetical protein
MYRKAKGRVKPYFSLTPVVLNVLIISTRLTRPLALRSFMKKQFCGRQNATLKRRRGLARRKSNGCAEQAYQTRRFVSVCFARPLVLRPVMKKKQSMKERGFPSPEGGKDRPFISRRPRLASTAGGAV